ncbi:30S ribosomal protein S4 [bacterium]|nr:30S ribosomal protein S4 [bacterium]|tara:strand:+ start:1587 stop:2213 length:627 start_codon:yes stop_codon:yes gene_type:complete
MKRQRKYKIQRKLSVVLPSFGDKKEKGPLAKRPTPPGFHGKTKSRRTSEFGLRLKEKQKIRFYYGLKEKQVRTLVIKSKRKESNWLLAFVDTVERRLDNLLFRLGFYPTIPAARQAVVHGHIFVNGKRCDIPSCIIPIGDEISLAENAYNNVLVQQTMKEPTLELPHYLKLDTKDGKQVGTVIDRPLLTDIPFEFEHQYFIEFYGKTK